MFYIHLSSRSLPRKPLSPLMDCTWFPEVQTSYDLVLARIGKSHNRLLPTSGCHVFLQVAAVATNMDIIDHCMFAFVTAPVRPRGNAEVPRMKMALSILQLAEESSTRLPSCPPTRWCGCFFQNRNWRSNPGRIGNHLQGSNLPDQAGKRLAQAQQNWQLSNHQYLGQ